MTLLPLGGPDRVLRTNSRPTLNFLLLLALVPAQGDPQKLHTAVTASMIEYETARKVT
jgi:hypothetical protein